MKKLYVLISDGGDGSYSPQFTMNEEWIKQQQDKYDEDGYEEWAIGVDGDGFHYTVITVPDDATLKSLGIHYDCAKE